MRAALKEIETLRDKFEEFSNESNAKIANIKKQLESTYKQLDISTNKVVKLKNELMLNKEIVIKNQGADWVYYNRVVK